MARPRLVKLAFVLSVVALVCVVSEWRLMGATSLLFSGVQFGLAAVAAIAGALLVRSGKQVPADEVIDLRAIASPASELGRTSSVFGPMRHAERA
ncbi:MAG: hypothetical protein N2037_08040 [Acidimicrobiales bacterium]|nr:hypothetical protein [Acidimicrobiales bacterium]